MIYSHYKNILQCIEHRIRSQITFQIRLATLAHNNLMHWSAEPSPLHAPPCVYSMAMRGKAPGYVTVYKLKAYLN